MLLCLAPNSHAQWVEAPGKGWVQVAVFHHNTRERFNFAGKVKPLFNAEAHSITTSVFLTAVGGVLRGIDVWAQVPFHWLQFNDLSADRSSQGVGDLRFHLRLGPALFGLQSPVPIALRAGVKLPVSPLPIDAEIVPLTEGQRDWEVMLELGHSFYPLPFYLNGWLGYRWREANTGLARQPGDERFFWLNAGGTWGRFAWRLGLEGLDGKPPMAFGLSLPNDRRDLLQVLPAVGYRLGPGTLEVGGRLPLRGRNLPAGPALFFGYFFRWGKTGEQ